MKTILAFIAFMLPALACGADDFLGSNGPTFETTKYSGEFSTGLVVPKDLPRLPVAADDMLYEGELPEQFIWQNLTPIRNQGSCGSCWAFSMTATFADVLKLHGVGDFDMSEQYLVSCDNEAYGCGGGWLNFHLYRDEGWVSEAEYPYKAANSACKQGLTHYDKIKAYNLIASGVPSPDKIKRALYVYGPLSVAVAVTGGFSSYRGGIYNESSSGSINHAVNIVGWDDTANPPYWIMRNSWGTGWGENGFMRIAFGSRKVGYAATFIDFNGPVPNPGPTIEPTPEPTPKPPFCGTISGTPVFWVPAGILLAILFVGIYLTRRQE